MYKRIMVPLDGSQLAECIFPHLETLVKDCKNTPEIIIVRAVEPISVPYGRQIAQFSSLDQIKAFETHQKTEAEEYLNKTVAILGNIGINAKTDIVPGKAGQALSDYANKNNIDLVIMTTHGRSGVSRLVWGSVADHLLRTLRVPVLMIRAPGSVPSVQPDPV
jgi:nucleotide-binding universal stress UspA family protein